MNAEIDAGKYNILATLLAAERQKIEKIPLL
jgi:hypothetical protein